MVIKSGGIMELFIYVFIVLSISGLLLQTMLFQRGVDNNMLRRIEFVSVVMTFIINLYLVFLLRFMSDDFRDSVDPFLGSSFMSDFFFFSFFVSFFYMIFYAGIELYGFHHFRIFSIIVFVILSINYINIMYQFYVKMSLSSYDQIGPGFTHFILIYVTVYSVYQVVTGRRFESTSGVVS